MRRILTTAAIIFSLPLAASADECVGTTLERVNESTFQMGDLLVPDETPVRVEVVGTELWVQVDELLSVTIPNDAVAFDACASGNVTFTKQQSVSVSQPITDIVNLPELWAFDPTPRTFGIF